MARALSLMVLSTGGIGALIAIQTKDETARRKIRAGNEFHHLFKSGLGMLMR